ncbi:tyrosine-type recombinase/integrase [Polycyclovorans algicola]|uniref:tyrosine-type recombinase/integrase n=1 Tax=Polycyclovorans algicola TaxID=616992 RepID=UPI00126860FE|nr:tyrosine-type recombinase/integrase [Polycyclovorans algicola]
MNPHLERLNQLLAGRFGASEEDVLDVLFMLRAHWNLAAIVLCCRRLVELIDAYPAIEMEPAFSDQGRRIDLIRQIAGLEDVDPHFLDGHIQRNRQEATPLRPCTGDSGLCDLLLISAREGATPQQQHDFECGQVWFTWQIFHHQARIHRRDDYVLYLKSDGSLNLREGKASRVYSAFRALRDLGDLANAASAGNIANQLTSLTADSSRQLALLLKLAYSKRPQASIRKVLMREMGIDEPALQLRVAESRIVSADLARFVQLIWEAKSSDATDRTVITRQAIAREVRRVRVSRYEAYTNVWHELGDAGIHEGFAIEVLERHPPVEDDDESNEDDEDPGDGEGVEPSVVLFLGKDEPITGWYSAKSAQHHIERANALLPWPEWRLSASAIAAVVGVVRLESSESVSERRARLTIGLSLLTGRSLDEVSALSIAEGHSLDPEQKQSISVAITLPDYTLHVLAGRPELKTRNSLPQFCAPNATTLRLPLPSAWHALIDSLAGHTSRRNSKVLEKARVLLAAQPAPLQISARGVAGALKLALLQSGRDDLALVKVVTDASEANYANLIHYASFERVEVERLWRQIAIEWVGTLPEGPAAIETGERVGALHGIEIDKVSRLIAEIKLRFNAAVGEKRWAAVYNALATYLALWLGVATAGRRTRHPVPGTITQDGWALIRDKHRPDGSTDRYVPLRQTLIDQLAVVQSLSSALSMIDPTFTPPPSQHSHRLVELRFFQNPLDSTSYRPMYLHEVKFLRGLPVNFGRKLVRSDAEELPGRYKDAGLGHWVRGRHPWTLTSTFPTEKFRAEWLAVQQRLEVELGFEVLTLEGLPAQLQPAAHSLPARKSPTPAVEQAPLISDEEINELLMSSKANYHEAVFEWEVPSAEAVLGLATSAVNILASRNAPDLATKAEAICEYLRKRTKVPVFAARPRARFQRDWLVSEDEFRSFDYVQRRLLPAIDQDLAHLPEAETSESALQVDLGRLIAVAALRGGLACTSHIDAFLRFITSDQPVQAVGEARLIELQVRSVRTSDPMRRSVLLEPYFAALVSVERQRMRSFLSPDFNGPRAPTRYARWGAALRAYLGAIGAPNGITLSAFLAAVRQQIQFGSAPILAAYASGEILTDDLPVSEFRRLAGLKPAVDTRSVEEQAMSGRAPGSDDEDDMPSSLRTAKEDFAAEIGRRRSPYVREWQRVLKQKLAACDLPAQRLLCAFALFLADTHDSKVPGQISTRGRSQIATNLRVVWHGFVGFSEVTDDWAVIDDCTLQSLFELTAPHFSARTHHGAWARFRTFLHERGNEIGALGFEIGKLAGSAARLVSAKILSATEIQRIRQVLQSVQSGIGTADNRQAAVRHFALTTATGARRAETEKLRWIDFDDDMIRIREYEGRRLKTASAQRALPKGLMDAELSSLFDESRSLGTGKPIDGAPGHDASGDNFFDRVAKAMKAATGDIDMGPHHLRHTKASALLLGMLANAVDLDRLSIDLPWVNGLLPPPDQQAALLGSAGQCGQGAKAISAMLGHLHETTTLRHYTHTLCVGLHAYLLGLPSIPLHIAFAQRINSRATLARYFSDARTKGLCAVRHLRDRLEESAQEQYTSPTGVKGGQTLVWRDESPLILRTIVTGDPNGAGSAEALIAQFEAAHTHLMEGKGEPPADIDSIRNALHAIASIRSGKKGSTLPRHPMPLSDPAGTPLPVMIVAGVPVRHAQVLLLWLLQLKADRPEDYRWLIEKWLYYSDAQEGSMRLDGEADLERLKAMPHDAGIALETRQVSVAKSRKGVASQPRYRLRIRFPVECDTDGVREAEHGRRAAGAIRWAMTWWVALHESELFAR